MCVFVGHSSGIVGMFSPRAVLPLCCLTSKTLIDSRCNRERERLKREYSKGGKNYTKWTKCDIKRAETSRYCLPHWNQALIIHGRLTNHKRWFLKGKVNLLQGDFLKWARMSSVPLHDFITQATCSCGVYLSAREWFRKYSFRWFGNYIVWTEVKVTGIVLRRTILYDIILG